MTAVSRNLKTMTPSVPAPPGQGQGREGWGREGWGLAFTVASGYEPSMRRNIILLAALCFASTARAADCPRPLEERRGELTSLLAVAPVPVPTPSPALRPVGAVVNDEGVRLRLTGGATAILANEWGHCRRGTGCEPELRQEIVDYFPLLGATLVAGWLPGRDAALYRLVDERSGAVTAIGGRPYPSPSGRLAAVVAGDNSQAWAGTEIWRFGGPVPLAEWEQDAPAPADYAFAGWRGDDLASLVANHLAPGQTAPLAAALVCAGDAWHLVHDTTARWLVALASPSGRRHALVRPGAIVLWLDGEQEAALPAVVTGLAGWAGEDEVVFTTPSGGAVRLRRSESGWRAD